jgi:hypothetical protein
VFFAKTIDQNVGRKRFGRAALAGENGDLADHALIALQHAVGAFYHPDVFEHAAGNGAGAVGVGQALNGG